VHVLILVAPKLGHGGVPESRDSTRFGSIAPLVAAIFFLFIFFNLFYQGVVCECIGTDSFVLKPDPRSERSRSLKCAKIIDGTVIPSNRVQYIFKVLDQYEQTQWFTAIDAEIREKKESLSINVLPMVISMDSISPPGLIDKSDAQLLESSLSASRIVRHRKGSLESSQLDSILNRKVSGKDLSSSREFGAGVVAAEWHGMDIAADFVSSDIRRAQHRGKNRAFPVQNIAVTRTPLDMGLVDHIRLAHSPEMSKDDSVLPFEMRSRANSSSSRRGSADDISIARGAALRRGSADDIVVPSLTTRQRLTTATSKPIQARSDWLNAEDVNHEGKVAVQLVDSEQLMGQSQNLEELIPEAAADDDPKDDESLAIVFAEASEQLKSTKEATARLSRALVLIEEMKTRWNALLDSELERLDVHLHSSFCI
jgi:hypothetical protein